MDSERIAHDATRAASSGSQRLPTQVFRERWEAHWIAEQRKASDVVTYADREDVAGNTRDGAHANNFSTESAGEWPLAARPARTMNAHSSDTGMPVPESQSLAREVFTENLLTLRDEVAVRLAAAQASRATAGSSTLVENTIDAASNAPSVPLPTRHYAIWRNGDSVRIALRVAGPESPERTDGVVTTLRGWLRAARLTLRELLINGKTKGDEHGH
jgi:hypothetical protein